MVKIRNVVLYIGSQKQKVINLDLLNNFCMFCTINTKNVDNIYFEQAYNLKQCTETG